MGDKNAPKGLVHKVFSARHRSKLLLPFCLLVVGIVWSSSTLMPFGSVTESRAYLRECATCAQDTAGPGELGDLDAVGASTTLQHKVKINECSSSATPNPTY
jgi:hypothetical protein